MALLNISATSTKAVARTMSRLSSHSLRNSAAPSTGRDATNFQATLKS